MSQSFRYQRVKVFALKHSTRARFFHDLEHLQKMGVYDVGEAIKCRGDMAKALGGRRKKGI